MSKFWKMHDDFVEEWEWWNVYPHHPLFEWLLTKAKVKDCRVRGVVVRRGSLLTTWEEMRKAVSNKYKTCSVGSLSRALKDLQDAREITLKTERRNTIVTICKYGRYYGYNEDIWSDSGVIAERKRSDTPIINKNIEYENNIYSAREFSDDDNFVTEDECRHWMRKYSDIARSFGVGDKDLPQQLSARRIQKIQLCVREMGRGTVDAMFARLAESAGYFDQGSRGWKGDFTNLWSPTVFDKILEGSFIPVSKRKEKAKTEQGQAEGAIDANEYQASQKPDRKEQLEGMVRLLERNPESRCRQALIAAYESGELASYGIDWEPDK